LKGKKKSDIVRSEPTSLPPRELRHRDNYFRTIQTIDKILVVKYNIFKNTRPPISIQKNEAGLNRAEVLAVLSALVLLRHI